MALGAIRKLGLSEGDVRQLYGQIVKLDVFRENTWEQTSPEVIEIVMQTISAYLNDPDPFFDEKRKLNATMMALEPFFDGLVKKAPDPLYMAVKLAIIGNTIDFMLPHGTMDVENIIHNQLKTELNRPAYEDLRHAILDASRIVYFTDNAGEIVLDKLLVKTLWQFSHPDVVFVVRNMPTLNDVTLTEAHQVELEKAAPVFTNGIDGPLPGTILKRCSPEIRNRMDQADLIISKGGGNFDCLEEDLPEINTPVSFLLLSKCDPYNTFFRTDLYQPVIANYFDQRYP
jgi:uncharacterized protein with ATP-grasp and redox domains